MGTVFVFCDLGTNAIEKVLKIVVIFLHHYNAINNIDLHFKLCKWNLVLHTYTHTHIHHSKNWKTAIVIREASSSN